MHSSITARDVQQRIKKGPDGRLSSEDAKELIHFAQQQPVELLQQLFNRQSCTPSGWNPLAELQRLDLLTD